MPHHKEKVEQAICYMFICALYDDVQVRMDSEHAGHGRLGLGSDITSMAFNVQCSLALIFGCLGETITQDS